MLKIAIQIIECSSGVLHITPVSWVQKSYAEALFSIAFLNPMHTLVMCILSPIYFWDFDILFCLAAYTVKIFLRLKINQRSNSEI